MTHSKLIAKGRSYIEKSKSIYNALEFQKTKEKNKTQPGTQPII